ncbi:MAG TPA: uroporphyrinogen decarboxylase family protein [bacterium]|nr:uroporphyrinogen decarboxylase family protein [bacterium]HOL66768.1 uroporphyrinogen decarboxylase family protein [bacterium]HPP12642.1 uroporphyrinogen decarboxylase family protein [bacterium]
MLEKKIQPDFVSFRDTVLRKKQSFRVHYVELFLDGEVQKAVARRFNLPGEIDSPDLNTKMSARLAIHQFLGYDMIRAYPSGYDWPLKRTPAPDTTSDEKNRGERYWQDEHRGPISDWSDFEKYPWPDPEKADFSEFDWCEKNLPEGMAFYALTAHILEYVTWLLGYEGLCLALFDQPDLVDAVFEKVGENQVALTRRLASYNRLGVVWGSDDMGFKGGCLISPKVLIEKALPWHRKCAEIAHQFGKMYFLHSCGKLDDIMEVLIDQVKIDAKHSWEDAIMPVTEGKKRWGHRIGILGGIDVSFLCQATEKQVRQRVRETLKVCLPGGGYCLGTGNSVANYIPLENYLAMLDEGRRYLQ